jgi:hypothetical protein
MAHSLGHVLLVLFIVLALVAFRLAWGLPSWNVVIRYLPTTWQRWLFGEPQLPSKKAH